MPKFDRSPIDDLPQSPAETAEALVDRLARFVVDRGMEAPAVLFLEMHKPLSFLAGQSALVAAPLLAPFVGMDRLRDLSELLSEPDGIETLLRRIEDYAAEPRPETPAPTAAPTTS
jgi:hypothetical protein